MVRQNPVEATPMRRSQSAHRRDPRRPLRPSPIYAAPMPPNRQMKERCCLPRPWIERLQLIIARAFPNGNQTTHWQPIHGFSPLPSPLLDATAPSPSQLSPSTKGRKPSNHGCYAGDVGPRLVVMGALPLSSKSLGEVELRLVARAAGQIWQDSDSIGAGPSLEHCLAVRLLSATLHDLLCSIDLPA